jgi:hypothetical protein
MNMVKKYKDNIDEMSERFQRDAVISLYAQLNKGEKEKFKRLHDDVEDMRSDRLKIAYIQCQNTIYKRENRN